MLTVLAVDDLKKVEEQTLAHGDLAAIDLMERAALVCAAWIEANVDGHVPLMVLAGMGNNGGDGAAIARLLHVAGRKVRLMVVRHRREGSMSFDENLHRAKTAGVCIRSLSEGEELPACLESEVVIDALFGIGLDRPFMGWLKEIVVTLARRPNEVIAIDLPSGLFADDNTANDPEAIVQADHTLALELPKQSLFHAENACYFGEWHVLPIGLDQEAISRMKPVAMVLEAMDVAAFMPARTRFAHKGNFGHAVLWAGSSGKVGAAVLAARACLRSGAGLITVEVPSGSEAVIHIAVPEAMVSTDEMKTELGGSLDTKRGCIGAGPGIGTSASASRLLKLLIQQAPAPLVLDADALNILSENPTWLSFLPVGTILTPHVREFERLAGRSESGHDRLGSAKAFAIRHRVVLVLKGAYTAICDPQGQVFFNDTGNPGMAKGGSGDALTGIITGLRAQGIDPLSAALLGIHAHGLAGDLAAEEQGMDGMSVTDLIEMLPQAWRKLRNMRPAGLSHT